jgi:hypothetical protein
VTVPVLVARSSGVLHECFDVAYFDAPLGFSEP